MSVANLVMYYFIILALVYSKGLRGVRKIAYVAMETKACRNYFVLYEHILEVFLPFSVDTIEKRCEEFVNGAWECYVSQAWFTSMLLPGECVAIFSTVIKSLF